MLKVKLKLNHRAKRASISKRPAGAPFLCFGQIVAKHQSEGTTAVVRGLVNNFTKGSAINSASHHTIPYVG